MSNSKEFVPGSSLHRTLGASRFIGYQSEAYWREERERGLICKRDLSKVGHSVTGQSPIYFPEPRAPMPYDAFLAERIKHEKNTRTGR